MMTMETRKNLSVMALLASAVCALFLIVSAFAAVSHQHEQQMQKTMWLDAEIHSSR